MNFRTRLFLTSLETRENPSVPTIDPIGGDAPPPVPPPATDPAIIAANAAADAAAAAVAAALAAITPPAPPPPFDPLTANNSIYNVPLVP